MLSTNGIQKVQTTLTQPTLLRPTRSLGAEALAEIATALLSARQIWDGTARFDPDERRPVRLIADESFEAWVIGWFSGQGLGLHDHGTSSGAVVVAEGRLHETTLTDRGPQTHALTRGVVRRIAPNTVHSVANLDARAATSIHVYSPPLHRMTHFDDANLRAVETVDVAFEAPVLPTAVARLVRIASRV